jgi:membrane-bound lytic murein transglycosylase D
MLPTPVDGPYAGKGAGEPRIPGFEQEATQRYNRQYSSPGGREWLAAVMKRAEPYLPFIREAVAKKDLPPELVYLPVIESGFSVTAKSRSGAAGLWQFMKNSVAPFDIKITDWADERMDFWKSTEGALRKLEDNYNAFIDWPLALAAYNAGLGAVRTVVRQSGIRDYWALVEKKRLKAETAVYVPKLLAASYILSNPRKFGLDLSWAENPRWARVPVPRQVDLELVASQAGVDAAGLKAANRELFYGITPPGTGAGTGAGTGYQLKVRGDQAEAVEAALRQTETALIRYYIHTVGYGDTLSALAAHYGISVDQISGANPGIRPQFLQIGQKIKIPALKETKPYERPAAGNAGGRAPQSGDFTGTHLVKRGETLWSIALAYGVDPETLANANNMGLNDTLREGKTLKTPILE